MARRRMRPREHGAPASRAPDGAPGSPVAIFSNEVDGARLVWSLPASDLGHPLQGFLTARYRAFRENSPSFLLDRYAFQSRLKTKPLGDESIEVPNQERGHVASLGQPRDSVNRYQ